MSCVTSQILGKMFHSSFRYGLSSFPPILLVESFSLFDSPFLDGDRAEGGAGVGRVDEGL